MGPEMVRSRSYVQLTFEINNLLKKIKQDISKQI